MSRNTVLICILGLAVLFSAPQASARPHATKDGEVAVPNVIGLIYIEAYDELQGAGFNAERLVGNLTTAHITDQCPHGGTLAAPGSFVALRIGGTVAGCPDAAGGGGGGGGGSGPVVSGNVPPPPQPKLVPLIFIPGIMGSNLVERSNNGPLWPKAAGPYDSSLFSALALDPQLNDYPGFHVVSRGPVLSFAGADFYAPTIAFLKRARYEEGDGADATLFTFGYDWRRSVADESFVDATQNRLALYIRNILDQTGRNKVDILAHSQGGLVAMAFLATHPALAQHVRRVVTIATPVLGAAKAIGIAKWAKPCDFPKIFGICVVDMTRVQGAVQNMPGVYELFPSAGYTPALETSPLTDANGHSLSFSRWQDILQQPLTPLNAQLMGAANALHTSQFENFDPTGAPYKFLRIIGTGRATPISFRTVDGVVRCRNLKDDCKAVVDGIETDRFYGDGTVAEPSASLVGICISGGPNCYNAKPASITNTYVRGFDHMGLATQRTPLCVATRFFGAGCPSVSSARTDTAPTIVDIDGEDLPDEPAPPIPTGIQVHVWGAADVAAMDLAGNPVGVDSFVNEQLVSFSDAGTYSVQIRPTDGYPVKVAIDRIGAAAEQRTTFFLPAPAVNETMTLPFTTADDLGGVRLIDARGNAITPSSTSTGKADEDGLAPTTIAGGTIGPNGSSSVELAAHDDGSGVGSSYVVTSQGAPARRYSGRFDVPLYSQVWFTSVDNAGNVENPQSIVADDTPGYRELATPIVANDRRKVMRTIFPQGDEDWFRFDANGTSEYRVELDGHDEGDYGLELRDANGTVVQSLHKRWHDGDDVRSVLPAGTYYVHVYGNGGAADRWHPYRLKLEAHTRDHEHGDR